MKSSSFHDNGAAPILPIWEQGVFLAERHDGFHALRLYQLDDTYIEVTHHTHFNVVLRVATFRSTDHLDPYLDAISIDALLG